MRKRDHFYGEFRVDGYSIYRIVEGQSEEVYRAGNNPLESSSYVVQSKGLPLPLLRGYCEQTGIEIANENRGSWDGCEFGE